MSSMSNSNFMRYSILLLVLLLSACSTNKWKQKTTVAPLKTSVVDIHAHFFNALDVEPGNFARMTAATAHGIVGVTPLKLTNIANNNVLKKIVSSHKKRLMEDARGEWFNPQDTINYSQSLTTQTSITGISDFFLAASTSRQGIAMAYFQNYPQVKLVTPSYVDLQGFAEAKLIDGKLNDIWSKSDFGSAYSLTTQGRHNFQSKLAKQFNKRYGEQHAILPIAGFNPIHGVKDHCDQIETDKLRENCISRFKSFQWNYENSSVKNYSTDFIDKVVSDANAGHFMGFKIYPHVGFYPINNCKMALQRIDGHLDDLLNVDNLKSEKWLAFNKVLPYAPLADLVNEIDDSVACDLKGEDAANWQALKVLAKEKIKADHCKANDGKCLANKILTGMKLAAIFDEQLKVMWNKARGANMPVITHASAGGAEQSADFEKYADLAYWQDFVKDYNKTFGLKACEKPEVRILLAHSLADGKFGKHDLPNSEFMKAYELVYKNALNKKSCVALYLDLSDSYIDKQIPTFKNAFPLQLSKDSPITLLQAMRFLLAEGRLLYGSDYFMNTLLTSPAPVEYLMSHKRWLDAITPSLIHSNQTSELSGVEVQQHYFHDNGLAFLGLNPVTKEACLRALTWFDKNKVPHWLKQCESIH